MPYGFNFSSCEPTASRPRPLDYVRPPERRGGERTKGSATVMMSEPLWSSVDVKKRKKSKPPVATRAADIVRFIEANGGKLGMFRCYLPAEPGPARDAVLRARSSLVRP